MEGLKPCPRCNGPHLVILKNHNDPDGVIQCDDCFFSMPTSFDWNKAKTELTNLIGEW